MPSAPRTQPPWRGAQIQAPLLDWAARSPDKEALRGDFGSWDYAALADACQRLAGLLRAEGLVAGERIAVFLDKRPEAVAALLGAAQAGGVFVPLYPGLRPRQVRYILTDSGASVLVTSASRLAALRDELAAMPALRTVVRVDPPGAVEGSAPPWREVGWQAAVAHPPAPAAERLESDPAAILYTSGSTGRPKGVVLSHRNLLAGAESVVAYLGNTAEDRIAAALPLSFDYGLSQVTTALLCGARCLLVDYLTPRSLLEQAARHGVTGLAGVPSLWQALAREHWPEGLRRRLRYITNSGGALPQATLRALRTALPETEVFLMYGLTEAFRSTYLPPAELARRPGSIGRAIPNAEIAVVRADGSRCAPYEPGELVHRGPLVALGYWNAPERSAERFRPWPLSPPGLPRPEPAVWSGDTVYADEQGYLYFLGRGDEMLKTSGFRVSPGEVEEVLYESGLVAEAVVVGTPDEALGQALVAVVAPAAGRELAPGALQRLCRQELPGYLQPRHWDLRPEGLPHTPHGKPDRARLTRQWSNRDDGEDEA